MIMRIIGVLGLLSRLAGLLLGVSWLFIGIMEVTGMSHDEKVSGPEFIGIGVFALSVVFAFSLRKRRAKKRAAARKADTLVGKVQESVKSLREQLMKEFEQQLDEQNVTDPAQRAELMQAAMKGIQEGTDNAIREQITKRV